MRLFLDANVLFTAAHNPRGKAAFVLELAAEGHWQAVTSALALDEARRNLARKFPECVERLDPLVAGVERVNAPPGSPCPVDLPEKDRPILAAALRAGASHLLTGDRAHFGPHMNAPEKTGGVVVQTVADFLRSL